jgi:L-threonylcarbamoyladenylate synthase
VSTIACLTGGEGPLGRDRIGGYGAGQRTPPLARSAGHTGGAPLPIVGPDRLAEVVERLLGGGIVAIPTDTVYGLAALPAREDALRALADLKGRDAGQPIAVLIDSAVDVAPYLERPEALGPVLRFWPGALTAIVRAKPGSLPVPVVTPAGTVGVRKPDDVFARQVIRACGGVLAVAREFGPGLLVLDGGPREGGIASTVVDLTGDRPRILREGPISARDLGLLEERERGAE